MTQLTPCHNSCPKHTHTHLYTPTFLSFLPSWLHGRLSEVLNALLRWDSICVSCCLAMLHVPQQYRRHRPFIPSTIPGSCGAHETGGDLYSQACDRKINDGLILLTLKCDLHNPLISPVLFIWSPEMSDLLISSPVFGFSFSPLQLPPHTFPHTERERGGWGGGRDGGKERINSYCC